MNSNAESLGIGIIREINKRKRENENKDENDLKRQKLSKNIPMTWGRIQTSLNKNSEIKTIKILLDSGASQTIMCETLAQHLNKIEIAGQKWNTAAGIFETNKIAKIHFTLPKFFESKIIEWQAHLFPKGNNNYEMIIGRDLLTTLGIDISFSQQVMTWDDRIVPMKSLTDLELVNFHIQESLPTKEAVSQMTQILDAKYEPANLEKIVADCKQLSNRQQKQLLRLLQKYNSLFDGSLGTWKDNPVEIELREGVTPYHAKPFPIPKAYELKLKLEVERLCRIGVLKRVNHSEWGAPTFVIPKKDGTIRFISDFRELNKRIKRKPYPIPKIQDLMLKLEGFQFGTSLDLNMGYYHIVLSPMAKKLCTIVLPFGKYEYQKLPMG